MPEKPYEDFTSNFEEGSEILLRDMLMNADVPDHSNLPENYPPTLGDFPLNFEDGSEFFAYSTSLRSSNDLNYAVMEQSSLSTPEHLSPQQQEVQLEENGSPKVVTIKNEEHSVTSPLSLTGEQQVNLHSYREDDDSNKYPVDEIFDAPQVVLSLEPWAGDYNFTVDVPKPSMQGVKPKYVWSEKLKKVYVARNVAFPVNISMTSYPPDATLTMCPVHTKSNFTMVPVPRCPNCMLSDQDEEKREHVVRIEGSTPKYLFEDNRFLVTIPLGKPAPGDSHLRTFVKIACNTSCIGGPSRRNFCVLITLKRHNKEIGRQIIDLKCCEGPARDMNNDEKKHEVELELDRQRQRQNLLAQVQQTAKDISMNIKSKKRQKRKLSETKPEPVEHVEDITEYEYLKIPKRYTKKVKKYVNELHFREQLKEKRNLTVIFNVPTSESEG